MESPTDTEYEYANFIKFDMLNVLPVTSSKMSLRNELTLEPNLTLTESVIELSF